MVQIYNKNADILTNIGIKFSIKNSFRFYISNLILYYTFFLMKLYIVAETFDFKDLIL